MTAADDAGQVSLSAPVPVLFGRAREQLLLRTRLAQALVGQGSLVLLSGHAGIGKTALAEEIGRAAMAQGALFLAGRCYDLAETPPYGPWAMLLARIPDIPDLPQAVRDLAQPDTFADPPSQDALFVHLHELIMAVAARQPLVFLLDDMHWADHISLEFLRYLSRRADTLPLLLIATYRADELTRHHPLYALLPILAHEAHVARLDLRRLSGDAVRNLVTARYALQARDEGRLVVYLQSHAEGSPFYIGELLRMLEEEGLLQPTGREWALGDLIAVQVPALLRQIVDGRLARLGEEVRELLIVAAIIGQEVPLALWSVVCGSPEGDLIAAVERAVEVHLLEETSDGLRVRFVHALIREALYEAISPTRRRIWHRQVGEALLASALPDPDAVAYQLRQGGDARAVIWLVRSGERAQRAYAWLTAAERYEAALGLLAEDGSITAVQERGWLLARLAQLRRYANPQASVEYLDEAARLAMVGDDRALAAHTLFTRGLVRCFADEVDAGLAELEAGAAALTVLSPPERARLGALEQIGVASGKHNGQEALVFWLAVAGRYREALASGEALLPDLLDTDPPDRSGAGSAFDLYHGLAFAYAATGQPHAAQRAFSHARAAYRALHQPFHIGWITAHELSWFVLPYRADHRLDWQSLAVEAEAAWHQANSVYADLPPRLASLPLLFIAGEWAEAHDIALAAPTTGWDAPRRLAVATVLGPLAREQGNPALAWSLIRQELPDGPDTMPGNSRFLNITALQRLAAALSLDEGNLTEARAWVLAHDRWLAWGGAILGQAEGLVLWGRYYRAMGNIPQALEAAKRALSSAMHPRQPLALLAAYRLLGQIEVDGDQRDEAVWHFDAALGLAADCGAPYERALTLLALARLRVQQLERTAARAILDEVVALCSPLNAVRALGEVTSLVALLAADSGPLPPHAPLREPYPARLTAREVEVLRLIVTGRTNREIAATLGLSARTVNVHVTHILTKTNTENRAAATAFAFQHRLT